MDEFNPKILVLLERAWPTGSWRDVNVAVALSGGADSVALLRAVVELKHRSGGAGNLCALHVNHQLRGAEADEDAAWCERLCGSLGVPITVLLGNPAGWAATKGDGLEAAARENRYQLMTQAAERVGVRCLATAHTRDDQVETVLLRMLRGTGLRGLSGIPLTRPLSPSLALVRPLLDVPRALVEGYLAGLGQDYRLDSSNESAQFTRNRVRHRLLPFLRAKCSADVDARLLQVAEQAKESQQYLEASAERSLAECGLERCARGIALELGPLSGKPQIVVCEAIRMAWRGAGLPEQDMTYEWWHRLATLRVGEVLNLPGNVRASTKGGRLELKW